MSEFANTTHQTTPPMTVTDCTTVRFHSTDAREPNARNESEHERHFATARSLPEVRAERIADIRRRIEAGTYDTDATLALALDRMFDELRHD